MRSDNLPVSLFQSPLTASLNLPASGIPGMHSVCCSVLSDISHKLRSFGLTARMPVFLLMMRKNTLVSTPIHLDKGGDIYVTTTIGKI